MDTRNDSALDALIDAADAAGALQIIGPDAPSAPGEAYFDDLVQRDRRAWRDPAKVSRRSAAG